MFFSKWVALTAAASIARASRDYCDEPEPGSDTNDSTEIVATFTTSFQNASALQPSLISYKETPSPTSISIITSSLTSTSSTIPSIYINTDDQSGLRISNTPITSSDLLSATASIQNAEITRSEDPSTSQAVPSLTLSKIATIRPAMALCVPTGGLCPSDSVTVVTLNRLAEATTSSSILSTITIVATSTRTVTSQQTAIPSARRARRSCADRSQISNSTTSQSPLETTNSSVDSGSQSQENASVMSSSTLQSDSISLTSELSGTRSTEAPTSTMSNVVVSTTTTASQAHTTTVLTLYSTVTPSFSSTSAAAIASSHSSGSTRAFESHARRTLVLGLVFIFFNYLLF